MCNDVDRCPRETPDLDLVVVLGTSEQNRRRSPLLSAHFSRDVTAGTLSTAPITILTSLIHGEHIPAINGLCSWQMTAASHFNVPPP